jgi:hypothetical protein
MKTVPVLVLGVIVIIIVSLFAIMTETARQPAGTVATTSEDGPYECDGDGFICPDGSVVGRTGPKCEFAKCPAADATSATIRTTVGQKMTGLNVALTPIEVTDDSRCPRDVQCIWAGTVKVRTKIESGLGTSEMVLELGQPVTTEAEEITLTEVTPGKVAGEEIPVSSYRFTFEVKKRALQ